MARYDFICLECNTMVEVTRTIANRNRPPGKCLEVRGLDEDPCDGKLVRKWTPVPFRVDRE